MTSAHAQNAKGPHEFYGCTRDMDFYVKAFALLAL